MKLPLVLAVILSQKILRLLYLDSVVVEAMPEVQPPIHVLSPAVSPEPPQDSQVCFEATSLSYPMCAMLCFCFQVTDPFAENS